MKKQSAATNAPAVMTPKLGLSVWNKGNVNKVVARTKLATVEVAVALRLVPKLSAVAVKNMAM